MITYTHYNMLINYSYNNDTVFCFADDCKVGIKYGFELRTKREAESIAYKIVFNYLKENNKTIYNTLNYKWD